MVIDYFLYIEKIFKPWNTAGYKIYLFIHLLIYWHGHIVYCRKPLYLSSTCLISWVLEFKHASTSVTGYKSLVWYVYCKCLLSLCSFPSFLNRIFWLVEVLSFNIFIYFSIINIFVSYWKTSSTPNSWRYFPVLSKIILFQLITLIYYIWNWFGFWTTKDSLLLSKIYWKKKLIFLPYFGQLCPTLDNHVWRLFLCYPGLLVYHHPFKWLNYDGCNESSFLIL